MIKRKLGQGLEVSALSLGAMGYGKSRDIPDRAEMIDRHAPVLSHRGTPSLAQRLRKLLRPDRTQYPKH